MTESFRHEDNSSKRMQLEDGQVEVFFDGSLDEKPTSIVLDTAELRKVSEDTPYGLLEYDDLVLFSGEVLSPADLSSEGRVMDFGNSFEPVVRLTGGALLRTIKYRQELKFLEIVKNDTTISERKVIGKSLLDNEQKRVPDALIQQREMFDADEGLEVWLRLEAANNPDKVLVGKVIMARLAYFMSHETQAGIVPIVYSADNGSVSRIPEQLAIHENWLYSALM